MKLDYTILIIEDDRALSQVLGDKFRREGFEVFQASDGRTGLVKALEIKPAVIILDIVMPDMDGLTMLKKLRRNPWGKKVPVLMLSNLSDPEQLNEAQAHWAIDYIVKSSWSLDEIVKKVRAAAEHPEINPN